MRILTVRQPWAEAIIFGGKDVENRVRNVAGGYRGPIAIHTAKREETPEEWRAFERDHPAAMSRMAETVPWAQDEYGVIIGTVDITDVHHGDECWERDLARLTKLYRSGNEGRRQVEVLPDSGAGGLIGRTRLCSPWAEYDAHHLVLANPCPLSEPIPFKGALGLRSLDADTVALIESRLL